MGIEPGRSLHHFQSAYAEMGWLDELLEKNPHLKWVDPQTN